ncbi:AaceriAAR169Cp [[Ashbya] aceris (nom. inval.)]|nr:AaceriAAR169Cp [[Ashbya] aceris (nom. inval.)]
MGQSAKEAVRARWAQVDYETLGEAGTSSAQAVPDAVEVVVLDSDEEGSAAEDAGGEEPERHEVWPLWLAQSALYDGEVAGAAAGNGICGLEAVLGDTELERVYLFSFQYEMNWLLDMIPEHVELVVTAQKGTVQEADGGRTDRVRYRMVWMPPFSSHHSKMVIAFYQDRRCRVALPSANFTAMEASLPQQMIWMTPRLAHSRAAEQRPSRFRSGLQEYLQLYPEPDRELLQRLRKIDFAPVDATGAAFVYSVPGARTRAKTGLAQLAAQLGEAPVAGRQHSHYFCQSSSIGGPLNSRSPENTRNLFVHLMVPLLSGHTKGLPKSVKDCPGEKEAYELLRSERLHPYILYPTVEDFNECFTGWLASGWFHFHHSRTAATRNHYSSLRDNGCFVKQREYELRPGGRTALPIIRRDRVPCHTKFYIKFTSASATSWDSLTDCEWFLFTSANLSTHAWGGPPSYQPKNYECGVLYTKSENVALRVHCAKDVVYAADSAWSDPEYFDTREGEHITVNLMTPFWLPAENYDPADVAFCASDRPDDM